MNYGFAFALGMLGSLHCAAMCGPLLLALPVPAIGPLRFVLGRVVYQLGRIATYCVLGGVAGLFGRSIYLSGLQRWLSVALGVAIILCFFLSKKLMLSATVTRLVGKLKSAMSVLLWRRDFVSAGALGFLNGLLPCGLVYVAMASAATSQTILSGVGFMAVFGLGTLPAMLGIALSGRMIPAPWRLRWSKAVPVGVGLVAVLLILRGLSLGIPYISPNLSADGTCCH